MSLLPVAFKKVTCIFPIQTVFYPVLSTRTSCAFAWLADQLFFWHRRFFLFPNVFIFPVDPGDHARSAQKSQPYGWLWAESAVPEDLRDKGCIAAAYTTGHREKSFFEVRNLWKSTRNRACLPKRPAFYPRSARTQRSWTRSPPPHRGSS